MKKTQFSEEQIMFAIRQVEKGASVRAMCQMMGVSEQMFYRWKKKCAVVSMAKVYQLIQLIENLSLDR